MELTAQSSQNVFRFAALFASCLLIIAGCSKARYDETRSGVLQVAIQSDVQTLNPLLISSATDVMITNLIFEPLLAANTRAAPVPMLATEVPSVSNGGISRDGLTITYHLQPRAMWSDGVPVTSNDVKWSCEAILNPRNNVISRAVFEQVSSIETPNSKTVVVHLKHRYAPFVNSFFAESDTPYSVAPEHVLSRYGDINGVDFNNAPNVSDGPFTFVRWLHGDRLEFAANRSFFMGKPNLDRIIIHVIPDENTEINALRTRNVDWIFQASESTYPKVRTIPDVLPNWVNRNGYEYVTLNTRSEYLSDVNVRRAIAYAIDKERLVHTLTFGQDEVALEDQPPFLWAFAKAIPSYEYNPQKAVKLLRQAGWSAGEDGMMWRRDNKLKLVLVTNASNATRRNASLEIQSMLARIGIDLELKYYPGDILFAQAQRGGILDGGKFDLSLVGWSSGIDPDDSAQFACANVAPNGYNFSRYCNPEMERAQSEALGTYDLAARRIAYAKIQTLLARDVPAIFLWYNRQLEPAVSTFKGLDPNPVSDSWNSWQWIR